MNIIDLSFCTVLKLNSGDLRFICLEAQTVTEKQSSFKVFFITERGQRPGCHTQIAPRAKRGLTKEPGPHYDYPVAALWRWRNKGGTWNLLDTAFTSFFLRMLQTRRQDLAAGRAKNQKGEHLLKIQYWMYAATGDPNVKWGAPISHGGRAPLAPPLATTLGWYRELKGVCP